MRVKLPMPGRIGRPPLEGPEFMTAPPPIIPNALTNKKKMFTAFKLQG